MFVCACIGWRKTHHWTAKKGVNILQGRVASRLGNGEIVNEDFIAMSAKS